MSVLSRRLYIAAWLALATVALGYFASLFKSTQNLGSTAFLPSIFSNAPSAGSDATNADPAVSQAIARMATEIDSLKAALEASRKENAALTAHVRTLESAFGPTTASLPPGNQPARPAPDESAKKQAGNAPPNVEVEMRPMPVDGFSEEIERAPLPIARPAKSTRTLFAVEIATGLSADEAKVQWQNISKKHASLLAKLEPRKVRTTGGQAGKGAYTLIAGPFNNAAAAALMCARLSIAGMNCSSTSFTGTPLDNVAAR